MKPKAYLNQDFESIKTQCLNSGTLFEDSEFSKNDPSIIAKYNPSGRSINWKRPSEIESNPTFLIDDAKANDIVQGAVGKETKLGLGKIFIDKN